MAARHGGEAAGLLWRAGLDEVVKWGHLVYLSNGPALLIRAEEQRVLFGFWRGQRLREMNPRLKPGGKYQMGSIELREGEEVVSTRARQLVKRAVQLNKTLGDPTRISSVACCPPMPDLEPLPDLDTAPLFTPLRVALTTLLRGLQPADWNASTVAGAWRVRDIVAHLLDGELRTLAAHRDGHPLAADGTVQGYADVIALVQGLNAEGVAAGRHWSPRILVDLLEMSGAWMAAFIATLDPDAPALFAVAWAGEAVSTNRFDTAREYTERWHHQMQIRLAIGDRGQHRTLLAERYAAPLLETAVRVLPHAYRELAAADGTTIAIVVDSRAGRRRCAVAAELDAPSREWRLAPLRGHCRQSHAPRHRWAGPVVAAVLQRNRPRRCRGRL